MLLVALAETASKALEVTPPYVNTAPDPVAPGLPRHAPSVKATAEPGGTWLRRSRPADLADCARLARLAETPDLADDDDDDDDILRFAD
jgi:hypothetical protein